METERKSKWGLWVMLFVNPFVILFVQNCSFFPTHPESNSQLAQKKFVPLENPMVKAQRGIASESEGIPYSSDLKTEIQTLGLDNGPEIRCHSGKKSCAE